MPVYRLTEEVVFPPPELASKDGLLAVGGDLSQERLLLAYSMGIFPWYSQGDPILWWSPDPRMVLVPHEFKVSKSLRKISRRGVFAVTMDQAFDAVIRHCADVPRSGQDGTWITEAMQEAYGTLHRAGYAHSVECWQKDELVGGLYGISLGACFFGESMFSTVSDASKVALLALVEQLTKWRFTLIDCQIHTLHLSRLGARTMNRTDFLRRMREGLKTKTRLGPWVLDRSEAKRSGRD